jgi:hypothetical protein
MAGKTSRVDKNRDRGLGFGLARLPNLIYLDLVGGVLYRGITVDWVSRFTISNYLCLIVSTSLIQCTALYYKRHYLFEF